MSDPNLTYSASGKLVTKAKFARLERKREQSAVARREGRAKTWKRRYTPKGLAFKKLTRLVFKLCSLLKARQYGTRIYHEPEVSVRFFWCTVDALIQGRHRMMKQRDWTKVEHVIDEIETLVWSWGFHWSYGVWRLWLDEGERIKEAICFSDRRERINKLIEDLPPTPEVSDEYKTMALTEKER